MISMEEEVVQKIMHYFMRNELVVTCNTQLMTTADDKHNLLPFVLPQFPLLLIGHLTRTCFDVECWAWEIFTTIWANGPINDKVVGPLKIIIGGAMAVYNLDHIGNQQRRSLLLYTGLLLPFYTLKLFLPHLCLAQDYCVLIQIHKKIGNIHPVRNMPF